MTHLGLPVGSSATPATCPNPAATEKYRRWWGERILAVRQTLFRAAIEWPIVRTMTINWSTGALSQASGARADEFVACFRAVCDLRRGDVRRNLYVVAIIARS